MRIGFSNPTARRFLIKCLLLTQALAFSASPVVRKKKSLHEFVRRVCSRGYSNSRYICQIRQIYPLGIYSLHAQIAPFPPPRLQTRSLLIKTRPPRPSNTPPHPPHRLFDLQDPLDKRIHFPSQLSDFVPLKNGFYSVRAQTD